MQLSPTQVGQYHDCGYLLVEALFDLAEVELLRDEANRVLGLTREEVWREAKSNNVRAAFAVHDYSDLYRTLARHPRLIAPAMQLLDSAVYMHQFKINAKAAFDGEGFIWHQDFGTWFRDDGMPQPRALNIAVYLDEVTEFNGPVWIIPKTHQQGVIEAYHDTEASSFALWQPDKQVIRELADQQGIFAVHGAPGTALFFHCQLLHASPPNLSPWDRNIVYMSINSVDNAARSFQRPAFIAQRDFSAIEMLTDDCLMPNRGAH